ncbi:hypothetical protein [Evansella clarkii]|jgi:heme/copper-type cytochrome/quinol oxidase subunit 2|uniref:hypothetical protein n=1 Tax=Evansella clarkii TaxID=79879 RepID=UPI000998969E|nr:hypothetical protein [Evansella clarkii]
MKFFVVKKKQVILLLTSVIIIAGMLLSFEVMNKGMPVFGPGGGESKEEVRTIHMVTGEFKAEVNGQEIESYRWDPGTIYMEEGERVNLVIYGVNGKEHPFYIEGTNIKGIVKQGEETVVPLKFKKEGTYRLICATHKDKENNGPMIAYIVVD